MNAFLSCLVLASVLAFAPQSCPGGACPLPAMEPSPTKLVFDLEPPDGEVWIGNQKIAGRVLTVNSGKAGRYAYEVRARWLRSGAWIEQRATPSVAAGETVRVRLTLPVPSPPAATVPMSLLAEGANPDAGGVNYGLQHDRFGPGGPSVEAYSLNGQAIDRFAGSQALAAKLPDDRKLLRLTLIGSKEFTAPILSDLQRPPLADVRDRVLVQTYTPEAWAVKDSGFKGGNQIYLQAPAGKVLAREETYPGAEVLAGAIREADKSYRPELDPGLAGGVDLLTLLAMLGAAAFAAMKL